MWRIPEWFPEISAAHQEKLKRYHAELLKFNLKVNLISRNTEREADEVHFADSILAAKVLLGVGMPKKVHDIGSGNGLPGVVLGILDSSREYVLVESDGRKCEFLRHVTGALGLKNVTVANSRFESLTGEEMTCAISRGVASISKTVLVFNKIFKKGSVFLHLKGNSWANEVAEIPSQVISHWTPKLIGDYTLPVSQAQRAVVATLKIS
jgi:16S rRNA (guanine527-N7)-methyltransferase